MKRVIALASLTLGTLLLIWQIFTVTAQKAALVQLSTTKLVSRDAPGNPLRTNSFPATLAVSADKRFVAILNNGWGTKESDYYQSIGIYEVATGKLTDFPDIRTGHKANQDLFYGLAFSSDGKHLYASVGSLTDPEGTNKKKQNLGNGIAVYSFKDGKLAPENFLKIPVERLPEGKHGEVGPDAYFHYGIPYPAGIAVVRQGRHDRLLVAETLADRALLVDAKSGKVLQRYDLSRYAVIPGSYPYDVVVTRDGKRAYVSLWNTSEIAELDLKQGKVARFISVSEKEAAASPHPTTMLLTKDERTLFVALSNADSAAVVTLANGEVRVLDTRLPNQKVGGSYPIGLALSPDERQLFVSNASNNAVAVFNNIDKPHPAGFIPTQSYPAALTIVGDKLLIASAKGIGTGPNDMPSPKDSPAYGKKQGNTYIGALVYGSLAAVPLNSVDARLREYTQQVLENNLLTSAAAQQPQLPAGFRKIKHVIYVIKENRTYDQVFGDIAGANGDPKLALFGEEITPNLHKLARQFGVLDNFYDSGEISGNGHVWSTAGITSDYTEKTWQIDYRNDEWTYDYEGEVAHGLPIIEGIPDVNEPGTGYLWTNFARHGITFRNYGEYIFSRWCNEKPKLQSPTEGTPTEGGGKCDRKVVKKGEPLPQNVGEPHGSASPYPWDVPLLASNTATKPELRGNFDPLYPDFELMYPDQLRADEFVNELAGFVQARQGGSGKRMPQFILLRLGNDHTSGTTPNKPTPDAAVADNDLALGRVVDAVSHSPYWDDTAIFVVEDDAQDGPDHVDAHRSIALAISKYSPRGEPVYVDHNFHSTVSMIHTMEMLLGAPPMNVNDAYAPVMSEMFTGTGEHPAFNADFRNRENGRIYRVNPKTAPGAKQSAAMDFRHADAADAAVLNRILWSNARPGVPYPATPKARPAR